MLASSSASLAAQDVAATPAGPPAGPLEKTAEYYQQARREVLALVPPDARRVLDVGCAEGVLGRQLLARGVERVIGLESDPEVAGRARQHLTDVHCGDVETIELAYEPGTFDCIVFADVLEHLREPGRTLARVRPLLAETGVIVSSIPNVRHYSILHMLTEGRWTYQSQGIMDSTHLRFFTRHEIAALFSGAGLEITSLGANVDAAYEGVKASLAGKPLIDIAFGRLTLKGQTPDEVADLFVVQYLLTARKAVTA